MRIVGPLTKIIAIQNILNEDSHFIYSDTWNDKNVFHSNGWLTILKNDHIHTNTHYVCCDYSLRYLFRSFFSTACMRATLIQIRLPFFWIFCFCDLCERLCVEGDFENLIRCQFLLCVCVRSVVFTGHNILSQNVSMLRKKNLFSRWQIVVCTVYQPMVGIGANVSNCYDVRKLIVIHCFYKPLAFQRLKAIALRKLLLLNAKVALNVPLWY